MAAESEFVELAYAAAKQVLQPPVTIERGAALLYQITVDNKLETTVDPKKPKRGYSAFQTDLCVFEERNGIKLPRVALEFKAGISTHDVLTYSAKARKHKQVYPYLRYGVVVSNEAVVPHRFFIHNEALDFFAALKNTKHMDLGDFFSRLLKREVATSKRMEKISFGEHPQFFRSEIEDSLRD
ncbi:hypothetical protein GJ689_19335 [Rhodoplanes serenus]|uniref:Uncharacterized protein n=1 Tax=Rhodoplanes serenus TaxID=200615 RepID=A0A9X4XRI1_9BRAD|nr:hypothetical protein [Rhodoplanes serenus]MTW18359.1 hypothetical protein [Rhodoplanes serenus]